MSTCHESLAALRTNCIPERYERNIAAIGIVGQIRLLESKVAIVGAGGLGGYIIEMLARMGVGCLRIIDGDNFSSSNLNRQILATADTLGVAKPLAAAERISLVNSDVIVEPVCEMLTSQNAQSLLSGMDAVVDALDSVSARMLVRDTCASLGVPFVHGAIAGFSGQVTSIIPRSGNKRTPTPLGALGENFCVGTPAFAPAFAAAIEACETIKLLTGIGEPLAGSLLYFDLEHNVTHVIHLEDD